MKSYLKTLILVVPLCIMNSCSNDDTSPPVNVSQNPNITYLATLKGSDEVPANSSTATGSATLTFNNSTKIFTISVNYSGLTPTDGHIHKGAIGESGPPIFGFPNLVSPINYTSTVLDATQEADLKANLYYVNLHSAAFTGGEIRGQLIKQTNTGGGGY